MQTHTTPLPFASAPLMQDNKNNRRFKDLIKWLTMNCTWVHIDKFWQDDGMWVSVCVSDILDILRSKQLFTFVFSGMKMHYFGEENIHSCDINKHLFGNTWQGQLRKDKRVWGICEWCHPSRNLNTHILLPQKKNTSCNDLFSTVT